VVESLPSKCEAQVQPPVTAKKKKKKSQPGMVVHRRMGQDDGEFKASLGYIARPCLKNSCQYFISVYVNN
jgi:hypothetical protein